MRKGCVQTGFAGLGASGITLQSGGRGGGSGTGCLPSARCVPGTMLDSLCGVAQVPFTIPEHCYLHLQMRELTLGQAQAGVIRWQMTEVGFKPTLLSSG